MLPLPPAAAALGRPLLVAAAEGPHLVIGRGGGEDVVEPKVLAAARVLHNHAPGTRLVAPEDLLPACLALGLAAGGGLVGGGEGR